MPGRGVGDRVVLHAQRKDGPGPVEPTQPAGEIAVAGEVVGPHLVDDDEHRQRDRRPPACAGAGGQRKERADAPRCGNAAAHDGRACSKHAEN